MMKKRGLRTKKFNYLFWGILFLTLIMLILLTMEIYLREKPEEKITKPSPICGDGTCDYVNGEDADNCPEDCTYDFKVIGQSSIKESSRGAVVSNRIYHASGVVVDKSTQPNRIYVIDSGNNRILGFESLGICQNNPSLKCTNDLDCSGSTCTLNPDKNADIIFGQTGSSSAACNGDNNFGVFKSPTASTLCLRAFPLGSNTAEAWTRNNIDVDNEGNLYIPDIYNNRILIYYAPFSSDKTGGKGDNIADFVIGQDDLNSNGINKGQGSGTRDSSSIYIGEGTPTSSRGVSVDGQGNVWIADTSNGRVLRFPRGSRQADLVLGQDDFYSNNNDCTSLPEDRALNKFCHPTLAKINPDTNELYVLDESGIKPFEARILVFRVSEEAYSSMDFTNGMSAYKMIFPNQIINFKIGANWDYFFQATGFEFNTYKQGEYANGVLWINEHQSNRAILIDIDGNIIKAIGAPDINTRGCDYSLYGRCGKDIATPYNLCWPGGSVGIDNANNIYLADEFTGGWNPRIARFALPYNTYEYNGEICLPNSNGGLVGDSDYEPNAISGYKFSEVVGTFTFENQLVVKDKRRYMIWNDYLSKAPGAKADFILGQDTENERNGNDFHIADRAFHVTDDKNRLWTYNEWGKLAVYQLPFQQGFIPLKDSVELYWIDEPATPIDYRANGIAFDKINKKIWVSDGGRGRLGHRLLRISNYDEFNNKLYVDAVIGQPNKDSVCCNQATKNPDGTCPYAWTARDVKAPTANSLCDPYAIEFDNFGNLYVPENNYEGHGNIRMTVFMQEDLASIPSTSTVQFPLTNAKKVFGPIDFTSLGIWPFFSPVSVAFNSKNSMVIGTDGYYAGDVNKRHLRQLLFYEDPLMRDGGSYVQGQQPDSYIEMPLGAPGETNFDDGDNLIVQDHTWNRVLIKKSDSYACNDGLDNDGDGAIDYGSDLYGEDKNDGGCSGYQDESEEFDCNDGIDNNKNGFCDWNGCIIDGVEMPAEPGCCNEPNNNRESPNYDGGWVCGVPPQYCGDGQCMSSEGEYCNTCAIDCGNCEPYGYGTFLPSPEIVKESVWSRIVDWIKNLF